MTITAAEKEMMLEALDRGEEVLIFTYGKGAKMRHTEKEAAKAAIRSGKDVSALFLKMVCMGLEYMYFCEDRQGEGVSVLLGKLSKLCGYQRIGMTMLEMRPTA